jgi:ankyrin repeat protein
MLLIALIDLIIIIINMLKKIFSSIALLVVALAAYSLPDVETFTEICSLACENKASKKLSSILRAETKTARLLWLSKFNAHFNSPIVYAVFKNNIPIIKELIEICLEDEISYYKLTTNDGVSMLTLAASMNQVKVIELLLYYNHPIIMDVNYKSSSALHEAAKLGNEYICRLLTKTKAGISLLHTKDYQHKTPVNYLIENKQERLVLILLTYAPVDADNIPLDSKGMNYLHYAVMNDLNYVVSLLLKQGDIDPWQKSFSQKTPLDLYSIKYKTPFVLE